MQAFAREKLGQWCSALRYFFLVAMVSDIYQFIRDAEARQIQRDHYSTVCVFNAFYFQYSQNQVGRLFSRTHLGFLFFPEKDRTFLLAYLWPGPRLKSLLNDIAAVARREHDPDCLLSYDSTPSAHGVDFNLPVDRCDGMSVSRLWFITPNDVSVHF